MKIFSTMLVTVTLLAIGLSFLSTGVNNTDNKVGKSSVRRVQSDEYHSQFKRRDFIMERRENERKERKEINKDKSARQVAAGRYNEDFMVYTRLDHDKNRYDDFR